MNEVELSEASARKLAQATADLVVDKLFEKAADEETVTRVASVWGNQLDRHIGKIVRRTVYAFVIGLIFFIGIKMDTILEWLKRN